MPTKQGAVRPRAGHGLGSAMTERTTSAKPARNRVATTKPARNRTVAKSANTRAKK